MMMKKELLTLCSVLCVGSLSAEWQLATDLDNGGLDDWTVAFNGEAEANPVGSVTLVDDPLGQGQGKVVAIDPGTAGNSTHNVITGFTVPTGSEIAGINGTKGTLYLKVGRPVIDGVPGEADIAFGMGTDEVSSPYSYGNFSGYARYEKDGAMDYRDEGNASGSFQPVTAADLPQDTNVYYEVWFVYDHFNLTYDVYIKGGSDFPTQTKVNSVTANYRNQSVTDLNQIFMLTSAGNTATATGVKGKDPIYFDDIYVDPSAENLTSPGGDVVPPVEGDLINIATRGKVGEGVSAMIAGFVVEGGTKNVLVQAVGPELIDGTVLTDANVLADPVLVIVPAATAADASTHITVDDWSGDDVVNAGVDAGATTLTAGSTSAATVVELPAGAYTVIVGGGTGVALVEVYDLD